MNGCGAGTSALGRGLLRLAGPPALAGTLLLWAAAPLLADGFHLPNFYEKTILESWERLKKDFKFPKRPKGKSWCDAYRLFPVDKRVRRYQRLRANMPQATILKSVIVKMIAVFKYTDPYNFAYDSPPWMRTQKQRAKSVQEARAVLREIGVHAVAYLWEAMEEEVRFANDPRRAGIEQYRNAQSEVAFAIEALREAMRRKEPRWVQIETELAEAVRKFWNASNYLGSAAGKQNAQYSKLTDRLEKLIDEHARKDPEIKKLRDAREKAKRRAKGLMGKVPGAFFTAEGGDFRHSDDFRARLREAIVMYGTPAKAFLRSQLRNPNPNLRLEAQRLLERIDQAAKKEQQPGAGKEKK